MNPAPLQEALKEVNERIQVLIQTRDGLRSILNGVPEPVQTSGQRKPATEELTLATQRRMVRTLKKLQRKRREGQKRAKPAAKWEPRAPLSAAMIEAGRKAKEPFGAADLIPLSGCTRSEGCNALVRWKTKGWVKNTGWGKYTRTEGFGDMHVETAAESARKSPGPPPEPKAAPDAPHTPAAPPAEEKLTPYSKRGIELGFRLKNEFTADELGTLLPLGKQAAYYWIAQWRNKAWIEKRDFDVWRKTMEFGE